ncbi:MAG: hypothetical protein V1853_02400 [bacterium]
MSKSIFESVEIGGETFTGEFVLSREEVDLPCEICGTSPAWRILLGVNALEGKTGTLPIIGQSANKVWGVIIERHGVGRVICTEHLSV